GTGDETQAGEAVDRRLGLDLGLVKPRLADSCCDEDPVLVTWLPGGRCEPIARRARHDTCQRVGACGNYAALARGLDVPRHHEVAGPLLVSEDTMVIVEPGACVWYEIARPWAGRLYVHCLDLAWPALDRTQILPRGGGGSVVKLIAERSKVVLRGGWC